jgi:glutamate carboxypeptidase
MLNFLRELVELSSETNNLLGIEAVQKKIIERLKLYRPKISIIESETSDYSASVLASWGAEKINPNSKGICLITHADTVYATQDLRPFEIDTAKGIAFGGGVADNKGGIVIALEALEKLFSAGKLNNLQKPLYFFSSSCEEMGSPGFQKFIREFRTKLSFVLGMEPALPGGHLIKKRRGNRYYKFSIHGNSVHTGRDLQNSANPTLGFVKLHELIEKLSLLYPQLSLSLNGVQSFPFKFNMSSEKILVTLDMRFENYDVAQSFHSELEKELAQLQFFSSNKNNYGFITFEIVDDCPSFETSMSEFLQKAQEIYSKVEGCEVLLSAGQGASDCCYFAYKDLQIVDGLGPRGGAIHSKEEFVEVKSIDQRSTALAQYLEYLLDPRCP